MNRSLHTGCVQRHTCFVVNMLVCYSFLGIPEHSPGKGSSLTFGSCLHADLNFRVNAEARRKTYFFVLFFCLLPRAFPRPLNQICLQMWFFVVCCLLFLFFTACNILELNWLKCLCNTTMQGKADHAVIFLRWWGIQLPGKIKYLYFPPVHGWKWYSFSCDKKYPDN